MTDEVRRPKAVKEEQDVLDVASPLSTFAETHPGDLYRSLAKSLADELKTGERHQGLPAVRQMIRSYQQATELLNSTLGEVLANVEKLAQIRERREKYSSRWWKDKIEKLQESFSADAETGFQQWLALYAESLTDWELDICTDLANADLRYSSEHRPYVLLIRHGDASIHKKEYASALKMLNYLADRLESDAAEDSRMLAALLLVFIGRIQLYQLKESNLARKTFQRAASLSPLDGRPLAAQGHGELASGESGWGEANRLFSRAIEFSPNQPDGFIGKACIAEQRQLWSEADEWCRAAIEAVLDKTDLTKTFTKLLSPAPGRLFLLIADQAFNEGDLELALENVNRSIELGVSVGESKASGAPPELKAKVLQSLNGSERKDEIAELYFEAAKYYYWDNQHQRALDLFLKSSEVNDQNPFPYFYRADVLRILSFSPTAPYANPEVVRESLEAWEKGISLADEITSDSAWVYVARSSIAKQLANVEPDNYKDHYWQSILYIERALIVDQNRGWWANLSGSYNGLSLYANMFHVSKKAEEGMPEDAFALEERAKVLINTGQFEPAEAILTKLLNSQTAEPAVKSTYRSWQAVIDSYRGEYAKALDNLSPRLAEVPEDVWAVSLRLNIYLGMGDYDKARDDAKWIWQSREDPRQKGQDYDFARAAFCLGMFPEAMQTLKPFLERASGDDQFSASLLSGLIKLASGEENDAVKDLELALEISNPRSVIDVILDMEELKKRVELEKWEHKDGILAYLGKPDGVLARALDKRKEMKTFEADPIKELESLCAPPNVCEPGSWGWLAIQASLGRLYLEAGRAENARDVYEALTAYPQQIPEAQIALKNIA